MKPTKPLIFLTSVFILSNLIERTQISHNRSVMRSSKSLTLRKYSQFSAMILATAAFLAAGKDAAALTVLDMRENLSSEGRAAYVDGVVEGLAFARWIADGRDQTGMNCILNWYYGGEPSEAYEGVLDFFDRHPDQHVGTLMYALIREECGEQE